MFETLRRALPCCRVGAAVGALGGFLFALYQDSAWMGYVVGPLCFGAIGAAAGFVAATFFYGIRSRGLRRIGKAALNSATGSVILVPLVRLLGWSSGQTLLAELASATVTLALLGAYFDAVEVWIPKKSADSAA